MKILSKVLVAMITALLVIQLSACALNKGKLISSSAEQVELQLAEIEKFANKVEKVFRIVLVVAEEAVVDGFITETQYYEITEKAKDFESDLENSLAVMNKWYLSQESGFYPHREELKRGTIKLILKHLDRLVLTVDELKEIPSESKQKIHSAVRMLNLLYSIKEVINE